MKYSHLISAVMNGKWFLRPQDAFASDAIIHKLLEREYDSVTDSHILSDSKPFMVILGSSKVAARASSYDNVPEESTAIVSIAGTMLKYGTMCSYGTTEIAAAIIEAANHPRIGSMVADYDSGGGSVDAIAPIIEAQNYFRSKGKSIVACVDLCASAAYYSAIYCNEIIAGNDISSEIGSIGVMMSFWDWAKAKEEQGGKQHTIYSNLSDWKNKPFELALKGEYEQIKLEELDPLAKKFQAAVIQRRGDKLKQETAGILAGRMFFAETAKEVGLIDHVGSLDMAIGRAREIRNNMLVNNYLNI